MSETFLINVSEIPNVGICRRGPTATHESHRTRIFTKTKTKTKNNKTKSLHRIVQSFFGLGIRYHGLVIRFLELNI